MTTRGEARRTVLPILHHFWGMFSVICLILFAPTLAKISLLDRVKYSWLHYWDCFW